MRWLVLVLFGGCVSSNSVVCDDGRVCPSNTTCDPIGVCVTHDQIAACDGKTEGDDCTIGSETGHCQGGACVPRVCGDGVIEIGEMCDDGNTDNFDGCSADCNSTEQCGNGVIDPLQHEQCDDGNRLDHDGCSSTCLAEQPHWIARSIVPPARAFPGSGYDSIRDRVVMFSGTVNGGGLVDDTWEWNGGEWIEMPTSIAPPGRGGTGMAFDARHHVMVMYGGSPGFATFSDTWLWDGSAWRTVNTPGPGPRAGHAMAYDAHRGRVVLFGGSRDDAGPVFFDDTWEWDGSTWTSIATAHKPPARDRTAMAYDPKRGVVVLATGQGPSGQFSDTWEYDGVDWTQKAMAGLPQVSDAEMTFDIATQRLLIATFIGTTSIYTWNGTAWSLVTTSGTAPPISTAPLFVGTTGKAVMFTANAGGSPATNTWLLANTAWSQPVDPGARSNIVFATDPVHGRAVLYGGETTPNTRVGDTWDVGVSVGYSLRANAPPTARSQANAAYDPIRQNIVMFGGLTGSGSGVANSETWVWNGSGWAQKSSGSVSARFAAMFGFDGQHVALVSGFAVNSSVPTGPIDTWLWDGTAWTPGAAPPWQHPRAAGCAAYDPIRKQLVTFGGLVAYPSGNNTISDETWLFDGTTWTQAATAGFRPTARFGCAMAWNPARKTIILTGGIGASSSLDALEWDGTQWALVSAPTAPTSRFQLGATTSLDGSGILVYGGTDGASTLRERWELRWDAPTPTERCAGADLDGDTLVNCADPDCWYVCAPLCPPGTTCDPSAARCGDGVCDANRETCRSCPMDCTCAPQCGDAICDPGETCAGDCP